MSEENRWKKAEECDWIPTEKEPLFDAADVIRCGMDLFVQKSMVTNDAGIDWLCRHYPGHRVHKVWYREHTPWHMDTTIIPLRPGLVLINPVRTPLEKAQKELFEKNDWEIIEG